MENQTNTFKTVSHPMIKPNTISVSPNGKVCDSRGIHDPSYHSSNGYMYEFIQTNDNKLILFPFDIMIATTFIQVPQQLIGKALKVHHINDDTSDCNVENLEWVEDIEEWKDIDCFDIKPGYYQISNRGKILSMLTDPPRLMKLRVDADGYCRLHLANTLPVRRKYQVHRLVGALFVKGYKPELQVNHIDGNKLNNYWYNLEWVTVSENIKHAYMLNLIENAMRKITEDDAHDICLSLNKHGGSIIDTFYELKDIIPGLTYPTISSIKYGTTFTHISDKYLTDSGRYKHVRQTDPDVILDVSYCLKRNNGDVKKTKRELADKYSWITYAWIWHLKDKSVASEITDLVFTKDEFPKCIPLTEDDAITIINRLLKYRGNTYVNQMVFDELKDSIPGLTKDKVRSIKEKRSWVELSDKYFNRGEI